MAELIDLLFGLWTQSGVKVAPVQPYSPGYANSICLGNWTTRGYANSWTGHLADWSTHGLDNSRSSQLVDWTTRVLADAAKRIEK